MNDNLKYLGILFLSYVILLFLPHELNTLAYIILGISIFLFMIGYFNLNSALDGMEEKMVTVQVP